VSDSAPRVELDPGRPGGRVLLQAGVWQSYTDLDDPAHLHFAYTQRVADAVDIVFGARTPLRAVHVGGGGLTLPRWLAATRPGSTSTVLELDPRVVALAHAQLGAGEIPGLTVRVGDARAGVARLRDAVADLVVGDAFTGRQVPAHLATAEFVAEVVRVLRPGGLYVLNTIDDHPFDFLRSELATLDTAFAHVGVVAVAELLARQTSGNAVLVASDTDVDWVGLAARVARRIESHAVLGPAGTARWCAGAQPLTDARQERVGSRC